MESFRISGLAAQPFADLFNRSDADLEADGVQRFCVDTEPGFPDRVTLRDLDVGTSALLVNYVHQPAAGPYRSSHAIFIGDGFADKYDRIDEIPPALRLRTLSLRAFDANGMMLDADLVDGNAAEPLIDRLLADPKTAYIHAHYAKRGCYAALIERATSTATYRSQR